MFKYNILITAIVTAIILCGIYSYTYLTTNQNISPVTYVSGKSVTEFPQATYEGVTGDGLKKYIYYEKDTIGQRALFFNGDNTCKFEVIVPKDNYALEEYIHYLNKNAMLYIHGGMATASSDGVTYAKVVQGKWRFGTEDGITNIFLIAGELQNPCYFLNTKDEVPFWLAEQK